MGPETGFPPEEAGSVRDASLARDAGVGPDVGSGPGAGDAASDVVAAGSAPTGGGPNFNCVNWADPGDNFQAGVLQPSGLIAATDGYATAVAKSNAILSGFQTVLGANSIRIPINEATVVTNTAWWNAYKGIVDAAVGKNMKVMIAYWGQAGNNGGKPADLSLFFTMWQIVVDAYGSNGLVYFDVMNEPWAYSPTDFIDLVVQWMGKYPSVPANRIVVAGNYNDSNVNQQGADARLAGCLLSVHIYAIGSTDANEAHWTSALATAVGPYARRTIVSEYGNDMTTGIDYGGAINGSAAVAYVRGITSQIRASGMGSCYWPGLRNGDTYSITQLSGVGTNLSLSPSPTLPDWPAFSRLGGCSCRRLGSSPAFGSRRSGHGLPGKHLESSPITDPRALRRTMIPWWSRLQRKRFAQDILDRGPLGIGRRAQRDVAELLTRPLEQAASVIEFAPASEEHG